MKGRGRPKGWKKPDGLTKSMMVRLAEDDYRWLTCEAKKTKWSASEVVRQVIKKTRTSSRCARRATENPKKGKENMSDFVDKWKAASSRSTPVASLVELARDVESYVRSMVSVNPSTPVALLVELAKDADADVSRLARATLSRSTGADMREVAVFKEELLWAGPTGTDLSKGATGSAGGPHGPTGPDLSKGATGSAGGPQGPTGPQGPVGEVSSTILSEALIAQVRRIRAHQVAEGGDSATLAARGREPPRPWTPSVSEYDLLPDSDR